MITFTLIIAAIIIVIGAFVLYNRGFDEGYGIGHDDGFHHAKGNHLPPLKTVEQSTALDDYFLPGGAERFASRHQERGEA